MLAWEDAFSHVQSRFFGRSYGVAPKIYTRGGDSRSHIFTGDQSDTVFMQSLGKQILDEIPEGLDMIVDDGSHIPSHMILSLVALWNTLKPGGVYVMEDIETSYWQNHAGIYGYTL